MSAAIHVWIFYLPLSFSNTYRLEYINFVAATKSIRNSLVWFTEMATVNKEMHIDVLRRLRDAFGRKGPEKQRANSWFLLHYNAPAYRSDLVKDFLAENNVTTVEHPPYCLDMAPADFYLFRWLKSALKGRRLCNVTDHQYECDGRAEKCFHKMALGMFPTPLQSLAQGCSWTRGLFWRKWGFIVLYCISHI